MAFKDPKLIDVSDVHDLAAWSVLLQRSDAEVREAVRVVGPIAARVAVYFAERERARRSRGGEGA